MRECGFGFDLDLDFDCNFETLRTLQIRITHLEDTESSFIRCIPCTVQRSASYIESAGDTDLVGNEMKSIFDDVKCSVHAIEFVFVAQNPLSTI